jgi:type II secretory pathway predicted ATPase ExeA
VGRSIKTGGLLRHVAWQFPFNQAGMTMSIARTKQHLEQVMGDPENRVVALTGSWGAGKSHLWREFSQGSNDEAVKASLYVSLFGLRDLNQVKAKLMQGVFLDTTVSVGCAPS